MGTITGTDGGETINGTVADDIIDALDGNDIVNAGEGNDIVNGGDGNDTMDGGLGDDILDGGAGDDVVIGGLGEDRLHGGPGDDVLALGNSLGQVAVLDGGPGVDTLQLVSYTAILPPGTNRWPPYVRPTSSFNVFGAITGVERLAFGPLNSDDGLTGTFHFASFMDGMNQVYGSGPNNTLVALVSAGGTYDFSGVTFHNWTGATVIAAASGLVASVTLNARADLEHQALTGGLGDDVLNGSPFGDALDGGGGADAMRGGAGDDSYKVDTQADILFEDSDGGTDSVTASTSFYLYANVENLALTTAAGNAFGVGNELGNVIYGNDGQNLLIGGGGDDEIHGGDPRYAFLGGDVQDAVFGMDGDDHLFGDAGADYIVAGAGDDLVVGGIGADEIYGEDGNDTLMGDNGGSPGIEDSSSDILVGGRGDDELWATGSGESDRLYGNEGNDAYWVDTPADLVFEQPDEGWDTVIAVVAGGGFYLYENVEGLILHGDTLFGVGNDLDNFLVGSDYWPNWLLGGAGDDRLNGLSGRDVLFGEAGSDIFIFEPGTGGDVIGDFTPGEDKIDLRAFGYSWEQVHGAMGDNSGTAFINLANGDFVVINAVLMASLDESDFIL